MPPALPIVDMSPLLRPGPAAELDVPARAIAAACRAHGFFYVVGHGLDPRLLTRLDAAAREFFGLPAAVKQEIAMARGGRAWRGWFPLGDELTSGVPDRKEGLYFGSELGPEHPRVRVRRGDGHDEERGSEGHPRTFHRSSGEGMGNGEQVGM